MPSRHPHRRAGAFALLLAAAAALLPPGQTASAEVAIGAPVPVGTSPSGIAVNQVTGRVYVANSGSRTVTVIDGATNTVLGSPIPVGTYPSGVAVNPATGRVYVANRLDDTVTVIDGGTNTVVGSPIAVGKGPDDIGVNPTTNRVYVASYATNSLTVIDGATNTVLGSPLAVGKGPAGIAVNPSTNRIFVSNFGGDTVTVVDGTSDTVIGSPIPVGKSPDGIGVNPATNRVYVSSVGNKTLTVIDGATGTMVGTPIPLAGGAGHLGVNPVTNRIYVASGISSVVAVDGATGTVVGSPIAVGSDPFSVGVNPVTNRAYVANRMSNTVSPIGNPFTVSRDTVRTGEMLAASWSDLFGPSGADFVGLYERNAPNASPLSRVYTNGTAAPGGAGRANGSVTLPIPPGLPGGSYDARLVLGASHVTFAQVAVTVLAPPVAAADAYTVANGNTLTVAAPGVLANDTDADSPGLTVTVETGPTHGTLALQPNGGLSYTPAGSFAGKDSFTYRVTDHLNLSATATVTIDVTAAAPNTVDDAYTVNHGSTLTVPAPGVLANDADADSPTPRVVVEASPANGVLALQPSGAFTYAPRQGFTGSDRFTYRATDQTGLSSTSTVVITVSPVACGPRPTVNVRTGATGGALQVTVTASDVDGPTRNRLKELRFGTPTNGRVELGGQSHAAAFVHTVPPGTATVSFAVRRATPGQPTTVPLTVLDECGSWPTLVGGGAGAGF